MKKLSKILIAMLVVTVAISMVACTPSGNNAATQPPANDTPADDTPAATDAPAQSGEKVTLRLNVVGAELEDNISATTGQEREGLNPFLTREFAEKNNCTIEFINIPWENCWPKQRTMMQSGEVDVMYTGGAMPSQYYREGLIREIDSFVEATPDFNPSEYYLEGLYDGIRCMDMSGTVHLGLPLFAGQRMTIQDTKLFEDWGQPLLPDKPTPDDVLNAAKAMTGTNPKTGDDNYGLWISTSQTPNGAIYQSLLQFYGAKGAKDGWSLADPANIEWEINTPEFKQALAWLKDVAPYLHPGVPGGAGAELKAQEGNQVAIYLEASGGTEKSKFIADGDDSWMKRDIPTGGIGPNGSTWIVFDPCIMPVNAQNQELAWELLRFYTSYDAQKWWYQNYQSAVTVANQDFLEDWDIYLQFNNEILTRGQVYPLFDELNDFWITDITKMFWDYVSNVYSGIAVDEDAILSELERKAYDWSASFK